MAEVQKRIYYGWYITAIAFIAYFLSTGTGFYAFNALLEPLCKLRGWNRTNLNLALVIGTMFGFICQYIYGTLIIKTGARILMLIGSLVSGLAFILIPHAETLWQFYLFYTVLFIGNGAYGGIVASTAVNNWFLKKRGQALGIATAGMSFSGVILPLSVLILIKFLGLSHAAFIVGLIMIGFGPLAWFVIRDWPEQMGLSPDGMKNMMPALNILQESAGETSQNYVQSEAAWNLSQLIKNTNFWKLGFAFAFLMIGTVGVMSQLKPRFTDIGYTSMIAMLMMSMTSFFGSFGKYLWGNLCDRFEPRYVAAIMALANVAGLCLSLYQSSTVILWFFIVIYGFSMGGIMSVYPVIVASYFGRTNFPSVFRFLSVFLMLQMMGYFIAGMSFDRTGSYDMAYVLFIIFESLAAILLFTLKSDR